MNSQEMFSKAIIGKALAVSLALGLTGSAALFTNTAGAQIVSANIEAQDSASSYSAADLDNLLAPIALYPDPMLAQVLVAATFDDQLQDASEVLSASAVAVDDQPWDDSVKAVAHYPSVLFTLAAQPDWTSAIGQAYVAQSTDLMNSIQRLRVMALAQGNLVSTQQQWVVTSGGAIQILPAFSGYMFLPAYDPAVVFSAPAFISFGPALAIDASSDDQIDWHQHHIFDRHHHFAKTGNRGSRGQIRTLRGPARGRFNLDARRGQLARGPVDRGRYNSGFTKAGFTNAGYNTSSIKPGSTSKGSTNSGFKHGSVNDGQSYPGRNRGQVNKGAVNNGAVTNGQANRVSSYPAVNRAQLNRGSFPTAMSRGFAGARPSGRSARR